MDRDGLRHGVLTTLGFAALTGNSALAIYWSRDDPRAAAFVAGAYGCIALLLHFLRRFERAGEGDGGRVIMDAQYCALAKVGLPVVMCHAALDAYDDARRDPGSVAFVLVSYVVLVVLTGLFVRAFARGHAAGEQGQGRCSRSGWLHSCLPALVWGGVLAFVVVFFSSGC